MATASSSASGDRDLSPADVEPAPLRSIRRTGLSIGVATGLYGISYGALATAAGLDVWQAMVLSAVMFTGGSQFAFVGVISGGGSAIGAALAALLLGVRNTLYGLTDRKSTRLNSSHVAISYAVFCLRKKRRGRRWGR